MTDDQDELRQHWQQLAEQLGLDATGRSPRPTDPSPVEVKESVAPAGLPTKIEDRGSKFEDRKSKIQAKGTPERESIAEYSFAAPESAPSSQPPNEPTEEGSAIDESPPKEWQDDRRGRRGRSDRGERTSQPRRGSRSRRRDAEPAPALDRDETFAEEEYRDTSESPEDVEPAILHDSTTAGPDQEEEDIDEVDTLSDWNVPSWTELIGSLYRPER